MSDPAQLLVEHLDIWTGAVERKNGAGRGNSSRLSLFGIEKLRSLIIDLAVQGKLAPQNPADEPASELLRRARRAMSDAISRNEMRAPKIPKFETSELGGLPRGWSWTRLIDITQINPRNEADVDVEASFIPMPLVSDRVDGAHETETRRWGEIRSGYTHLADGDIALAKITPCFENGKAAVFSGLANGIGAGTTELHVARPLLDELDRRYLLLTLKTPRYLADGEAGMTGTAGQKRVPRSYFELTPFPLPPLAEQKRIVAKVDELMALCDALEAGTREAMAAHEKLVRELLTTLVNSKDADDVAANWSRIEDHFDTLFTTEDSIEALKQTILDLAIRGRLVRQDPRDEPAGELIKRARKATGAQQQKAHPPIETDQHRYEVPRGWCWERFDNLIEPLLPISYGVLVPGDDHPNGVPFVRIADLSIEAAADLPEKAISPTVDAQYERTRLRGGEILMGVVGSIGKLGVAPSSWAGANIARAICRIVPASFMNRDYVLWLLQSRFMQDNFQGDTRTLAQPTLNIKLIRLAPTPVPPRAEQERIASRLAELMKLCDGLKHGILALEKQQTILADEMTAGATV